jgi:hypothetical protein
MISLISLVWVIALFNALLGFQRGWYREIVITAAVVVSSYVVFQFDPILRGVILSRFSREQVFIVQFALFLALLFFTTSQRIGAQDRRREGLGAGVIGMVMGAINGYLIGGTIWYFLDINEYPFSTILSAPQLGSPSANAISSLPLVIFSGGVNGSGEFLVFVVIGVFLLVLIGL